MTNVDNVLHTKIVNTTGEGNNETVSSSNPMPVILYDTLAISNVVGVFGEQLATDIKNDVIVQFQYGLSSYDATSTTSGTGTTGTLNHMLYVSTGTGAEGDARVQSVSSMRYRPGHTALCNFSAMFENGGVTEYKQEVGALNDDDGIYLGYDGTIRYVAYLNDGVETQVTEDSWNGDSRVLDADWTKLNIFRIKFGWLGGSLIVFEMLLPGTNDYVPIHTFRLQGTLTEPHIGNPSMPIQAHVFNKTGGTGGTDVIVRCGSWQGGVFGLCQTCGNRPFADEQSLTLVTGGAEQAVVNYRSVDVFQGKNNKVKAKLLRYQFYIDPPSNSSDFGTVIFRLKAAPVLGGTPVWTNIDATNSVIQYDTAGTYTGGSGTLGLNESIGYAGGKGSTVPSEPVDADQFGLFLDPTQTYTLTAQCIATGGADTPTVRVAFNWVELF